MRSPSIVSFMLADSSSIAAVARNMACNGQWINVVSMYDSLNAYVN